MSRHTHSQHGWENYNDDDHLEDPQIMFDYEPVPHYSYSNPYNQSQSFYGGSTSSSNPVYADPNLYASTQDPPYTNFPAYRTSPLPAGSTQNDFQNDYNAGGYSGYYQPPSVPEGTANTSAISYDPSQPSYNQEPSSYITLQSQYEYATNHHVRDEPGPSYSPSPSPDLRSSSNSHSHSHRKSSSRTNSKHGESSKSGTKHSSSSSSSKNPRGGPPKALLNVFDSNVEPKLHRNVRKPFTDEGKKKVEAVRSLGACPQCRERKRECETRRPCRNCVKRTKTPEEAAEMCCQPVEPDMLSEPRHSDSKKEKRRHGHH